MIDPAQVCAGWEPIHVSRADVLTEGTASRIEAHNEQGVELGCWRPPGE